MHPIAIATMGKFVGPPGSKQSVAPPKEEEHVFPKVIVHDVWIEKTKLKDSKIIRVDSIYEEWYYVNN